jgi:hypothetical protein
MRPLLLKLHASVIDCAGMNIRIQVSEDGQTYHDQRLRKVLVTADGRFLSRFDRKTDRDKVDQLRPEPFQFLVG